jgi:hypothetical protein
MSTIATLCTVTVEPSGLIPGDLVVTATAVVSVMATATALGVTPVLAAAAATA